MTVAEFTARVTPDEVARWVDLFGEEDRDFAKAATEAKKAEMAGPLNAARFLRP
jgi:hypothetical protein